MGVKKTKNETSLKGGYILGLDLGVTSVGWAIVPTDTSQISADTLKMGVRSFEMPVEAKNGKPKNAARREARQSRKGYRRTRRRMTKLFNRLRDGKLLPEWDASTPEKRQEFLNKLDRQLFDKYYFAASHIEEQTFLYSLRARALDEKLELCAVGRIFLHLASRRGFLSNKKLEAAKQGELEQDAQTEPCEAEEAKAAPKRKAKSTKKSENPEKSEKTRDDGVVKEEIEKLNKEMRKKKARTLGEFFANVNPEGGERIRTRYLGREQIRYEFDAIWKAQARFYPDDLTPKLYRKVKRAIFSQRPLKSQRKLVGFCPLEWNSTLKRGPRCVAKGDPAFQEYRIWQFVLDLQVYENEKEARQLTSEEQDKIVAYLNEHQTATCAKLSDVLGFKGKRKENSDIGRFNFETKSEGEKTIYGNVTRTKIVKTLTKYGVSKSDEEIDRIAREILVFGDERALARRLRKMFPEFGERFLSQAPQDERDLAEALADVQLSTARASLSRRAAIKLTEAMKTTRRQLKTVELEIYGKKAQKVRDFLPSVVETLGDPRNPVVLRTLTEMRKVVNEIIKTWGKPELIRVELSRDLKKSATSRKKIERENTRRQKERDDAKKAIERIKREYNDNKKKEERITEEATSTEILKYRLWLECGQTCPYTSKHISLLQLLGLEGEEQVDVEHIVPFSRSFDNSFANKTLCFASENRNRKKNQTPFECYGQSKNWERILSHVAQFKGAFAGHKLGLFTLTNVPRATEFKAPERMLNDTRYLSKLATKYLGVLYGATNGSDAQRKKRIQTTSGGATRLLCEAWKLDSILNPNKRRKNRDDLRHHAVDALAIALTDKTTIEKLALEASETEEVDAWDLRKRESELRKIATPPSVATGEHFNEVVRRVVEDVVVSHRVSCKISGKLHDDSHYGAKENEGRRAIRQALTSFTVKQFADIVEPQVRKVVCEKWFELVRAKKFQKENEAEKRKKFDELANELLRLCERRDDVKKEFGQLTGQFKKLVRDKEIANPLKGCEPDNWPKLPPKKKGGQSTPIKKARYWKTNTVKGIGRFKLEKRLGRAWDKDKEQKRLRYVETSNNSHFEVYALLDKNGVEKPKWDAEVVTRLDAYERVRKNKPVVCRNLGKNKKGEEKKFLFSLTHNEAFTFQGDKVEEAAKTTDSLAEAIRKSGQKIYIVRTIPQSKQVKFQLHTDGGKSGSDNAEEKKTTEGQTKRVGKFKEEGFRKLRIDVLGRVFWANE